MATKHRGGQKPRDLRQRPTTDQTPPQEPAELTEADLDFAAEEANLDAEMKVLKAKRAKLAARRKQALGGKKLERMRKYAQAATDWAQSAATKFATSTKRANDAVGKLDEYEEKLGLTGNKALAATLAGELELLVGAAESIPLQA